MAPLCLVGNRQPLAVTAEASDPGSHHHPRLGLGRGQPVRAGKSRGGPVPNAPDYPTLRPNSDPADLGAGISILSALDDRPERISTPDGDTDVFLNVLLDASLNALLDVFLRNEAGWTATTADGGYKNQHVESTHSRHRPYADASRDAAQIVIGLWGPASESWTARQTVCLCDEDPSWQLRPGSTAYLQKQNSDRPNIGTVQGVPGRVIDKVQARGDPRVCWLRERKPI
ncbi:uncharacterized protein LY79DRAFT_583748 [Colletotrichum navitas]|uniref:Uncharacterized protein n=1 Tax=Colletotrichum navitas TaxID=681940 RepID=A0AAD8PPF5_9PEZI|nr:uncharacterized protein LY79DRAFT_583748 [Colletotrichum navitas]KAK1573335.1 hypothetical protein LY79DRAFT_583748 [Colletotrichum navitas]